MLDSLLVVFWAIRTFLEIYPKEMYEYNQSKHMLLFKNGSLTDFGYCDSETDVYKYQSSEYDVIRFDEATHFTGTMYEYLRTRIRGANKFPKQTKCSTNPGSVGHHYFKSRFIDVCPPMETYELIHPRTKRRSTRLFIPSRVYDNTFLMEADPDYINRLEDLPEEQRKALLDGSWDLYEGQFFPEFNRDVHVYSGVKEPHKSWRIYFTLDYGLDMFAGYFIAVDEHDRAYVLGEIYEPDQIISQAAQLIKDKQKELGIAKVDEYLGPGDMWNRRQETGLSVADIFWQNGIPLRRTSRDRVDGWAAVKEWLHPFKDELGCMTAKLTMSDRCVNLIRSLPSLQYDEHRSNDVATTPHEITHAPDAIRGFCVYRSRANKELRRATDAELRAERDYVSFNKNDMFNVYQEKQNADSSDSFIGGQWGF